MNATTAASTPRHLLPRAERRASILKAAARAFARNGFTDTSLDDVAREAGVTKMILYRHFESKRHIYEALLEDMRNRLRAATGAPHHMSERSIVALVDVAAADPDGFRIYFLHAASETEFRPHADQLRQNMAGVAGDWLAQRIPDERMRSLAAQLVPTLTIHMILAWLDAGQPPVDVAAVIQSVLAAATMALVQHQGPSGSATE